MGRDKNSRSTSWFPAEDASKLFKPLALMYYKLAGVLPSEGIVESLFSLSGFVLDGRRYNLNDDSVKSIVLLHMWQNLCDEVDLIEDDNEMEIDNI